MIYIQDANLLFPTSQSRSIGLSPGDCEDQYSRRWLHRGHKGMDFWMNVAGEIETFSIVHFLLLGEPM